MGGIGRSPAWRDAAVGMAMGSDAGESCHPDQTLWATSGLNPENTVFRTVTVHSSLDKSLNPEQNARPENWDPA